MVSRFSVDPTNPNVANPNSEQVLLTISQPFSNHNGGNVAFGPDGYLYIGMGDGGSANDPQNNGQTLTSLLGKMLRIDVDNQDPGLSYAIPPDNPFADPTDGIRDEIWAVGVRNPWRFSFDRLTGDLWIGDVGQGDWEEIDFQPAGSPGGENYGWRCYEGNHAFNTSGCGAIGNYIFPVFDYSHAQSGGCSVTGGVVYRGCRYPNLYGHYVFADYCNGQFWSIASDGASGWDVYTLSTLSSLQYTAFGEDYQGELYVTGHAQGRVYRVTETSGTPFEIAASVQNESCEGNQDGSILLEWTPVNDPVSVLWNTQDTGPALENLGFGAYCAQVTGGNGCQVNLCLEVTAAIFNAPVIQWNDTILSVPEGYSSYQWYLDEVPLSGATGPSFMPQQNGPYTVEVTNEAGCSAISDPYFLVVQSLEEPSPALNWGVSPNPFQHSWEVQLEFMGSTNCQLEVFGFNGQLMWTRSWSQIARLSHTIDGESWPAGTYWVRLSTSEGKWVKRLVKQ
ncbi:MAG: PQQ-dependent sugar dehydrogenase [Saprospirales bacterium]|nr:PQQ-dependent sugar dehydrogenase [Saprospirales bacterium]